MSQTKRNYQIVSEMSKSKNKLVKENEISQHKINKTKERSEC